MNRDQRRQPEKQQQKIDPKHEQDLFHDDRQQDEVSVRAKSSGHKKKTADKWNQ